MNERIVVGSERQVERLAREGIAAETRSALARRLLGELADDDAPAPAAPEVVRMALDLAMQRVVPAEGARAQSSPASSSDALVALAARAGGARARGALAGGAWAKTVDAVDGALGTLRTAGATDDALAAAARAPGTAGSRAGMLRAAMRALDEELARAGLVDGRAAGTLLSRAIGRASPDAVARAVGASRVLARGIVAWDAADVAWWRALDLALARRGGGARVELPAFDRELDPERERDPLEVVADDVARALDDAPLFARIGAPLGDLRLEGPAPREALASVDIVRAADAHAQARAVADAVHAALAAGTPVDRVAVALPRIDEETLGPIRRALDDAGIVAHDPRGPAPAGAGLVACALDALGVGARGLPRAEVAVLLRSRYLDAQALTGLAERRDATRRLLDLARALDETPTARDEGALAALVATARAFRPRTDRDEEPAAVDARASLAERVGEILARPAAARTYAEHAREARALFAALGLGPRMGAGARTALAKDARAEGLARAELRALARDAHAWDVLDSAIASWEAGAARLGVSAREVGLDAFHRHLARVLDVGAPPLGAARAGAVRVARLAELAGEELALLVVVDANDGVLPSSPVPDPLLPDALCALLGPVAPASHALRRARELASLALAAASADRVVVVCRARDEQGASIAPAPLVAWLERGGVKSRPARASTLGERPLSAADARLAQLHASPSVAAEVAPDAARRAAMERRREAFFYDPRRATDDSVGALAASGALARALAEDTGAARPLAVTALERVARCPFQGYATTVLGARDRQRRGELPDAREEGTLLHEALAVALSATADLWAARPRDRALVEARAMAAVDELFTRELVGSPLRDVVLARARDDVRAVLAWTAADEAWDFARAEQAFGEGSEESWPPLRLDAGGAPLLLRGKIDRVDVARAVSRARAIDYKRSKRTALDGEKEAGELAFQVPLYALVAARALGRSGADGLYLPTGARDLREDYRPREAFTARWAELVAEDPREDRDGAPATRVERAAAALIGALRAGDLAPVPRKSTACAHCDVRGGCRQPRFAVAPDEEEEG